MMDLTSISSEQLEQWKNDFEQQQNYDFSIYSIVRYFHLAMENNPNMVDSLFVPANCILHISSIGNIVRDNRKIFLHKGSYHKFKGYAYSMMHKMASKTPEEGSKRHKLREEFGMDTKYAYHLARLADECDQILNLGDIDLQRSKEYMKAIRRGEVPEKELKKWFSEKEISLEKSYNESKLQYEPDENKIKQLLLNCLEHHYGNLSNCVVLPDAATLALKQIKDILSNLPQGLV